MKWTDIAVLGAVAGGAYLLFRSGGVLGEWLSKLGVAFSPDVLVSREDLERLKADLAAHQEYLTEQKLQSFDVERATMAKVETLSDLQQFIGSFTVLATQKAAETLPGEWEEVRQAIKAATGIDYPTKEAYYENLIQKNIQQKAAELSIQQGTLIEPANIFDIVRYARGL